MPSSRWTSRTPRRFCDEVGREDRSRAGWRKPGDDPLQGASGGGDDLSRAVLHEHVPDAADRLDLLGRAGVVAELLAQMRDVHVDRAIADGDIAAARIVEKRVASDDASGAARERQKNVEFDSRELDVLPSNFHLVTRYVDR